MQYPILFLLISSVSFVFSNNLTTNNPDITIKNGSSNSNFNKTSGNQDQIMFDEIDDTIHKQKIRWNPNEKNGKTAKTTNIDITASNGKEFSDVIDGHWSSWGKCHCNEGIGQSVRTCSNPVPRNSGKTCQGYSSKTENCCPKRKPVIKCIENKKSDGKCMCGNVKCDNKDICIKGTCLQDCVMGTKLMRKCMCGNVQCGKGKMCIDGKCLEGSQDKNPAWVKQEGMDCYNGHGAIQIGPEPYSNYVSLDICKAACRTHSSCEAIIRNTADQQNNGKCFLRKNLNLQDCKTETIYTLYHISTGGSQDKNPVWVQQEGMDCYNGHGAIQIGPEPHSNSMSLDICKAACRADSSCEAIIRNTADQQNKGKCFLRKNLNLEDCKTETIYTLYYISTADCLMDKQIMGKCMCGNVQCGKGKTCIYGNCLKDCKQNTKNLHGQECKCEKMICSSDQTCFEGSCIEAPTPAHANYTAPDCLTDKQIMSKCMCGNVQCGKGKTCIDGNCLEDCKQNTKNPNGQKCKCERMTCSYDQICFDGSCIEDNDCFYLWVNQATNQKDCRCSFQCKLYGIIHLVYKDLSRQLNNIKEASTINFYMAVGLTCLVAAFVLIALVYAIIKLINWISKSRYNQDIKQIFSDK